MTAAFEEKRLKTAKILNMREIFSLLGVAFFISVW